MCVIVQCRFGISDTTFPFTECDATMIREVEILLHRLQISSITDHRSASSWCFKHTCTQLLARSSRLKSSSRLALCQYEMGGRKRLAQMICTSAKDLESTVPSRQKMADQSDTPRVRQASYNAEHMFVCDSASPTDWC